MSSPTTDEIEQAARRASTGSVARALTILDELTAGAHENVRPQIAVAFYRDLWNVTPHDRPGAPMFEPPKTDFDDGLRDPRDLVILALVIAVLGVLCGVASIILTVTR